MKSTRWLFTASCFAFAFTLAAAAQSKNALPAPVAKAVADNRPGAAIATLQVETEAGIKLYDIEFKAGKGEIEVAEDGTVLDISTIVGDAEVPKPAMDAIKKAAIGATVRQLEKSEIRAEIQKRGEKGTIVKLPSPKYVYEAELAKGKQSGEMQVAPDGTIVESLKWGTGEKTGNEK